MNNTNELKPVNRTAVYLGWFAKRLALLIFDVGVSYLAYFLALVIRFFANGQFLGEANKYLEVFNRYAPYHAVLTVIVFLIFGLYTSRWKYAGINDLTRILASCLILAAAHFAGTCLLYMRMPLSYYFLGAFFQFLCTLASRFSYYALQNIGAEYHRSGKNAFNVMVVGVGDTANYITKHFETRENGLNRVVCYYSWGDFLPNGKINGVPVISGQENFVSALKKYKVKGVVFGDPDLSGEPRRQLSALCKENNLEIEDYSDILYAGAYSLSFSSLMKVTACPVTVRLNGKTTEYSSGEEALVALPGGYIVQKVGNVSNHLTVEIAPRAGARNDLNTDWVRQTEQQTGEPVSFF